MGKLSLEEAEFVQPSLQMCTAFTPKLLGHLVASQVGWGPLIVTFESQSWPGHTVPRPPIEPQRLLCHAGISSPRPEAEAVWFVCNSQCPPVPAHQAALLLSSRSSRLREPSQPVPPVAKTPPSGLSPDTQELSRPFL